MEGLVQLILDGLIVALLAGTIFFAARLSLHLKVFRESRKELESLIGTLTEQTETAHTAIEGMRETARQSGRDLQQLINEAKSLTDEMEIMTEAGNNMANRLERNAETAARGQGSDSTRSEDIQKPAKRAESQNAAFMIHDRELGDDDAGLEDEDVYGMAAKAPLNTSSDKLQSQAERELFEAMQARKKSDAGGVS